MTREFVVETDLDLTAVVEFEGIGQKFKPHEEIVRCKDCKHWRKHSLTDKHFCELVTTPTKSYWVSKADDYCSRAERKEVEQCIDRES